MQELEGPTTLTREELYERVWATPIFHLAREFGLSDVGFAKVCKRHRVPRPPQGYWTKLRHGKKVNKPPLPPAETGDEPVHFGPRRPARAESHVQCAPAPKIKVPQRLVRPHPFVATTMDVMRKEPDKYARVFPKRGTPALDIGVGRSSVRRAMRIMNALIKALEARSHKVTIGVDHDRRPKSCAIVSGEEVRLRIRETARKQPREATPREIESHRRHPEFYPRDHYEYVPTGVMSLQILGSFRSVDRSVSDNRKRPLEDALGEFMCALTEIVDKRVERRRQDEIKWARRQAEEKERQAKLEVIRRENARVERLLADAEAWNK
jgi:hypothetical protein